MSSDRTPAPASAGMKSSHSTAHALHTTHPIQLRSKTLRMRTGSQAQDYVRRFGRRVMRFDSYNRRNLSGYKLPWARGQSTVASARVITSPLPDGNEGCVPRSHTLDRRSIDSSDRNSEIRPR
ncbi:hypothetical protein J6590_004624 [Homalodisca vitripennis]|nr:hypothetical protein J6590_004624 [Homalodisca vitripennis]